MLSVFQGFVFALFLVGCLYSIAAKPGEEMKHGRGMLIISGLLFLATHIILKVL